MQLPDFSKHEGLNQLRGKIGADLIEYESEIIWDLAKTQLLEQGEVSKLSLDDIGISADGFLFYIGYPVVVYPRVQPEQGGEGAYKFHFFDCATFSTLREDGISSGEFVANNFGEFTVMKSSFGRISPRKVVVPLHVCKNCLKESNYMNYNVLDYTKKNYIYNNFSREEYFSMLDGIK